MVWISLPDHLQANSSDLAMSTVNYAEVLILVQDRQPGAYQEIREAIETSSIRLISPTERHEPALPAQPGRLLRLRSRQG